MNLVIITGISGSGKTSVARELARQGHLALDSKLNPGLFHFLDSEGRQPTTNHPNDPSWKARHKWVINHTVFNNILSQHADAPNVYLCGGGDSLKPLWSQAKKVFFLRIDAPSLINRLNDPSRDNQFAKNEETRQILLNRLNKYQSNLLIAGAIPINSCQPIQNVVHDILEQSS